MIPSSKADRRPSYILFGLAAAAAILSLVVLLTGGFSVRIFGLRISSHGALRPLLSALLFGAIAYRRMPVWQPGGVAHRVRDGVRRLVPWTAPLAATIVLAFCFMFGSRAAGGSDSYGYVSQARLWLTGDLHVHQDFAASVPWPNADWTFTPLGYSPAENHTLVPTYAPGLPLLMALFLEAGGNCGPFVVTPLCSAVLVLLTAVLGWYVSGRTTGALAALLTATSPTILMISLWPMSDVPAAAFWVMALVAAWRPRSFVTHSRARSPASTKRSFETGSLASAALSGIAAGIAIAIRPNLLPLVLFPAGLVIWRTSADTRSRVGRASAFALACLPFVLLIAWVNHDLYGSFLMSGYGDASSIYNWQNLGPNLRRYPRWLWETQGAYAFVFLFTVALPPGPKPESRMLRWILLAYIAAVLGCYLFYIPFDDWWYLRFVIPAMPAMFVLSIDAIWQGSRRFGPVAQAIATVVFTALSLSHATHYGRLHTIFEIGEGEQKYADVGRYLAREVPPGTVVISGLHAGSIRLYANLRTLRVDLLDGAWLDRAINYLKSHGPSPYIVLEGSEIENFRQRFASQEAVTLVDRPAVAVHSRHVYVFSSDPPRSGDPPQTIPHTEGCR
jgi:hypothetical protein